MIAFLKALLMATTIVSGLTIFSDGSGHGNQSHLVYAVNQARWWLFNLNTKTATVVSCYVSSSNDLTTATWSASTDSPAFPSSRALSTNDLRNLGCLGITNGSTDAVHVSVGIGATGSVTGYMEHIRATFTGASSITWESWKEFGSSTGTWETVKGNTLGLSNSSKFIHEYGQTENSGKDADARKMTNADSGATWTNTGDTDTPVVIDTSIVNTVNVEAFSPLASDVMVCIYGNGGAANPNMTNLRYTKSGAAGAWSSGTGTGDVFGATNTQDFNDWCKCDVDLTHIYAIRRTGSNTFGISVYDGTSWTAKTAPPTQSHKAASGLFAVPLPDATAFYLFLLDSVSNQPVQYCKYTVAGDSWGSWTQLESAGATARNFISGCPVIGNNQIGIIWTAVNAGNFDIQVSALALSAAAVYLPWDVQHSSQHQAVLAM